LGIGDWGLGPIPNPQSPIPNPQSPIPIISNNDIIKIIKLIILYLSNNLFYFMLINFNLNFTLRRDRII
jgi:hypothetical protein